MCNTLLHLDVEFKEIIFNSYRKLNLHNTHGAHFAYSNIVCTPLFNLDVANITSLYWGPSIFMSNEMNNKKLLSHNIILLVLFWLRRDAQATLTINHVFHVIHASFLYARKYVLLCKIKPNALTIHPMHPMHPMH